MSALPEIMISHPEELVQCCADLAQCPVLGFDTEFVGEDTYHPSLCLVQVATPQTLYLIDPLTVGSLTDFWRIVAEPTRTVVVHAGREETRLCRLFTGNTPTGFYDLQLAAGLVGLHYPLGHGTLCAQVLGVNLNKAETLTEWRERPLSREQVRYAFDDVRYLLKLWEFLHQQLEAMGRLSWAHEEFARLAQQAAPEEPCEEKWRRLRSLGSLDRRKLAMVREVFAWREAQATRCNRPARTLLRDDLVVEVAKRNPRSEEDLHRVRGLAKRDCPAIFAAIERARALPNHDLPHKEERENDPPQLGLVTNILQAVLGDWCARYKLSQSLVASSSDLKALVRAHIKQQPLTDECGLAQGWRAEQVLPELQAVLTGNRSIRIVNLASNTPFHVGD